MTMYTKRASEKKGIRQKIAHARSAGKNLSNLVMDETIQTNLQTLGNHSVENSCVQTAGSAKLQQSCSTTISL